MTKSTRKPGLRLTRWFRKIIKKNRPPYRWYEHDWYGS
jgi:hypothetical protein